VAVDRPGLRHRRRADDVDEESADLADLTTQGDAAVERLPRHLHSDVAAEQVLHTRWR